MMHVSSVTSLLRRSLASALTLTATLSSPVIAFAQEAGPTTHDEQNALPALRGGFGASLGFVLPIGAAVARPDGSESDVFSAGAGLDLRGGVQFTDWLAFDLTALASTIILAGSARVAALVELAPIDSFAIGIGGGVGSLYVLNFLYPNPTASYWLGLLRAEGRLVESGYGDPDISLGGEAMLGRTLGGDPDPGTITVGGRFIFGLLWR